jgi:hypothetical protein
MNERTRALRYISEFWDNPNGEYLLTPEWDALSEKLYDAASDVARALGTEK